MIHLKVKGRFQQINEVLEKYKPVTANLVTFRNEPQTYLLTIDANNDVTAKLIVALSLVNVTMMGEVRGKKLYHFDLTGI